MHNSSESDTTLQKNKTAEEGEKKPPALRRFKSGFRWEEIEAEPYKLDSHPGGEFQGATRHVLIGKLGEDVAFHVRYFELEPYGFTSLERHHHAHAVIVLRGKGRVKVGNQDYEVSPFDVIYIGPDEPHQLRAEDGVFGFLCIVNAIRDRPRPVNET